MNSRRVPLLTGAFAILLPAVVPFSAFGQAHRLPTNNPNNPWTMEDSEVSNRSFSMSPGGKLSMDLVEGYIHVTGYDGAEVRVNVERRNTAKSGEALSRAHQQVSLDMSQEGGGVRVYANGPFRAKDHNNGNEDYRVQFNCEVQVPRGATLDLRNLNSGIQVKNVTGDFEINGLNGSIDMEGLAGSGNVHTLNGKLKVAFARNPTKDSQFHSLNGAIDVYFQPPLNAELHYHTLNGGVWADFDVQTETSGNGHMLVGSDRENGGAGKAGSGGPTLSFDALNGAIRLHTKPE